MNNSRKQGFAFGKVNYRIMITGVLLIILGFILMSGGGSENPKMFNPEIFSFRRITLAPLFVLTGFATVMFAIMKKIKNT